MRRVHREGLDGTGNGNETWRTAERRKRPCVRPATFETGSCSSGGVWRATKRRKRTSYGRNGGPIDWEGCGVPQNGRNGLVLERYGRNGGPVHREGVAYRKTGLHRILFISTVDLLQPPRATVDLLQPPRAPVHPASMGSCSSSLHRALLHRLLLNHPSTVYYSSSPPHHGVLFNHPSTGTPPPSIVHPALHTTGSCSSRGNATTHCSSNPPGNAHCSSNRSASVSSSSEGIARSGSVNSHRSIARVK